MTMRRLRVRRVLSAWLILALSLPLALPPPTFAMRVTQEGGGLEELKGTLAPRAGAEEGPACFLAGGAGDPRRRDDDAD